MRSIFNLLSNIGGIVKVFILIITAFLFFNLFVSSINACQKFWTGAANSEWNVAENWCPIGIPDSTENVTIPYILFNEYPIIENDTINIKSLKIGWGAELTIQSGR